MFSKDAYFSIASILDLTLLGQNVFATQTRQKTSFKTRSLPGPVPRYLENERVHYLPRWKRARRHARHSQSDRFWTHHNSWGLSIKDLEMEGHLKPSVFHALILVFYCPNSIQNSISSYIFWWNLLKDGQQFGNFEQIQSVFPVDDQ